jgi:hypothetical protein
VVRKKSQENARDRKPFEGFAVQTVDATPAQRFHAARSLVGERTPSHAKKGKPPRKFCVFRASVLLVASGILGKPPTITRR